MWGLTLLAQTDVPPIAYGGAAITLLGIITVFAVRVLRAQDRRIATAATEAKQHRETAAKESAECKRQLAWRELTFEGLLHVARMQGLKIPLGLYQQVPPIGQPWPTLRELIANGFDYEKGEPDGPERFP